MNWLLIILLFPFLQASGDRYVAPYGAGAECSADAPCAFASTLTGAGGGVVWLLPGTYAGSFTANAPGVTYRSVPGTRARIDGSLSIIAPDTTWKDLEITHTDWPNRTSGNASTLYIYGARTRVLDSYIHDLADGVGFWKPAVDAELRGNLIYNNGYGSVGHSLYAQNVDGTKRITHNVIGPAYGGFAVHIYGSAAADALKGFDLESNVIWGGRMLIGGQSAAQRIRVTGNVVYGATMELGYTAVNSDVVALDNTVIHTSNPLKFYRWQTATVRGNQFIQTAGNFMVDDIHISPHAYDFGANTWRYGGSYSQPFSSRGWAGWQAATGDTTSTFDRVLPSTNDVRVWSTGPHQGRVTVLNWSQAQTVTLDLAPLSLTPGAEYRLINAQNPAESLTFTAGAPVALSLTGWSVAVPYGASAPLRAWDARFSVWLVQPWA